MSTNAMVRAAAQATAISSMSNLLAQFLEAYQAKVSAES